MSALNALNRMDRPAAGRTPGAMGAPVSVVREPARLGAEDSLEIRRDLLETLDRIVYLEHTHFALYGHYTKVMNRLGLVLPARVQQFYDIRVAEASQDRFLLVAMSEQKGMMEDWVSVDQEYRVRSNFALPLPRRSYLHEHARRYLKDLQDQPASQRLEEFGIYKGYFRYEREALVAYGVRAPVLGSQVLPGSEPETGQNGTHVSSTDSLEQVHEIGLDPRPDAGRAPAAANTLEIEPISPTAVE